VHLALGISLFIFLFYTWIAERGIAYFTIPKGWKCALKVLIALAILQVCLGGVVSGMKAALNYPTWPTMNGEWVPSILWNTSYWNRDTLLLYDHSGFMPALVQFMHRMLAYGILVYILIFAARWYLDMEKELRWMAYVLVGIIVVQVLLGILTLLGSHGSIPVLTGVLHQGLGIIFLTTLFYMNIRSRLN
jgi:cytochrome c oxidase assembly protein subunit 15